MSIVNTNDILVEPDSVFSCGQFQKYIQIGGEACRGYWPMRGQYPLY